MADVFYRLAELIGMAGQQNFVQGGGFDLGFLGFVCSIRGWWTCGNLFFCFFSSKISAALVNLCSATVFVLFWKVVILKNDSITPVFLSEKRPNRNSRNSQLLFFCLTKELLRISRKIWGKHQEFRTSKCRWWEDTMWPMWPMYLPWLGVLYGWNSEDSWSQ